MTGIISQLILLKNLKKACKYLVNSDSVEQDKMENRQKRGGSVSIWEKGDSWLLVQLLSTPHTHTHTHTPLHTNTNGGHCLCGWDS